jgi:hypothetical protein
MPDINSRNAGRFFTPAKATTAELTSAANAINTKDKKQGKFVLNTTTNKLLTAGGSTPTSPWYDTAGTSTHTPA